MHPLTPDLSELTDEELHKKAAELQSRLGFAYSMGNPDMIAQLNLVLDDHNTAIRDRNHKLMDKLAKKGNFGNIIDIS